MGALLTARNSLDDLEKHIKTLETQNQKLITRNKKVEEQLSELVKKYKTLESERDKMLQQITKEMNT